MRFSLNWVATWRRFCMMFPLRVTPSQCRLLCWGLLILLGLQTRLPAEDWPQFRGPRGDGNWHGHKLDRQMLELLQRS